MSDRYEFEFEVTMLVTAEDENDAYGQISDSGLSPGALIGYARVENVGLLERGGRTAAA